MFFTPFQKLFSFLRCSNVRILESQISRRHDNKQEINKKYISLNNLESKSSLVMKFGQFMAAFKRKNFESCHNDLETSSRPFGVYKE